MKNITLLGDSNFVGEWNNLTTGRKYLVPQYGEDIQELNKLIGDFGNFPMYGITHPGISYFLEKKGYRITNCAIGGSSNIQQLAILIESLGINPTPRNTRTPFPDVIIWCITEPFRDLYDYGHTKFSSNFQKYMKEQIKDTDKIRDTNREILKLSFDLAETIHKITKVPFIIVEGQSSTLNLDNQYSFIKDKVDNWIPGILDLEQAPTVCTFQTYDAVENHFGKHKSKEVIEEYSEFLEKMRIDKVNFPDGGHPSAEQHRILSDTLHQKLIKLQTINRPDHIEEISNSLKIKTLL